MAPEEARTMAVVAEQQVSTREAVDMKARTRHKAHRRDYQQKEANRKVMVRHSRALDHFIVDSGASHSVCCNRTAFESIDFTRTITLYSGANIRTKGQGIGIINIVVADVDGNERRMRRSEVVWCPDFCVFTIATQGTT